MSRLTVAQDVNGAVHMHLACVSLGVCATEAQAMNLLKRLKEAGAIISSWTYDDHVYSQGYFRHACKAQHARRCPTRTVDGRRIFAIQWWQAGDDVTEKWRTPAEVDPHAHRKDLFSWGVVIVEGKPVQGLWPVAPLPKGGKAT